jgi:hypothetical protein
MPCAHDGVKYGSRFHASPQTGATHKSQNSLKESGSCLGCGRSGNGLVGRGHPTTRLEEFCRVDWGLSMLQVDVCFLRCHLASRWCHNISAIHQLYPSPSQNRTSVFPDLIDGVCYKPQNSCAPMSGVQTICRLRALAR